MAGEWLKVESATPEKPEVLQITVRMGWDDPDLTVGKLFKMWRWFDQQTTDGNAVTVTCALLNRIVGAPGFAEACASVGWLTVTDSGISLPNFERHNGATAKSRAQTAKRVANHKSNAAANAQANDEGNADSVSGALPREEKRREERNTPLPPKGGGQRFEDFWLAWPKNERKQDKAKCEEKWRRDGMDRVADAILADIRTKRGTEKWREGFIEAPLVYLRGKRWEDGVEANASEAVSPVAGAL